MNIYFTASISQKSNYGVSYINIVNNLRKLGYDVIADHILYSTPDKIRKETREEKVAHYRRVARWIGACDLVVAELSDPSSANVGVEVYQALQRGKPVIALYSSAAGTALFKGAAESKVILADYDPPPLEEVIPRVIEDARQEMEVRFNFFLSAGLSSYLEAISKQQSISKAEFLRKLITEYRAKNPLEND